MIAGWLCVFIYALLLAWVVWGYFLASRKYIALANANAYPTVSVLIPFRNEYRYLPILVASIQKVEYPNTVQWVWIDDDSTDSGSAYLKSQGFHVISNSGVGKQAALQTGLREATGTWIVTLDADTIVRPQWLTSLFTKVYEETVCVVGGVQIETNQSLLGTLQSADFSLFQAITKAAWGLGRLFLANGANLALRKDVVLAMGGWQNMASASGDDIWMIQKIQNQFTQPHAILVSTAAESCISTHPILNVKLLHQQRVRWAAKTRKMKWHPLMMLGLAPYVGVSGVLLVAFENWMWGISLLALKIGLDTIFLHAIGFRQSVFRRCFAALLLTGLHPVFYAGVTLGALGRKFTWKGRKLQ